MLDIIHVVSRDAFICEFCHSTTDVNSASPVIDIRRPNIGTYPGVTDEQIREIVSYEYRAEISRRLLYYYTTSSCTTNVTVNTDSTIVNNIISEHHSLLTRTRSRCAVIASYDIVDKVSNMSTYARADKVDDYSIYPYMGELSGISIYRDVFAMESYAMVVSMVPKPILTIHETNDGIGIQLVNGITKSYASRILFNGSI